MLPTHTVSQKRHKHWQNKQVAKVKTRYSKKNLIFPWKVARFRSITVYHIHSHLNTKGILIITEYSSNSSTLGWPKTGYTWSRTSYVLKAHMSWWIGDIHTCWQPADCPYPLPYNSCSTSQYKSLQCLMLTARTAFLFLNQAAQSKTFKLNINF